MGGEVRTLDPSSGDRGVKIPKIKIMFGEFLKGRRTTAVLSTPADGSRMTLVLLWPTQGDQYGAFLGDKGRFPRGGHGEGTGVPAGRDGLRACRRGLTHQIVMREKLPQDSGSLESGRSLLRSDGARGDNVGGALHSRNLPRGVPRD